MVAITKPKLIGGADPAPYPDYSKPERIADGIVHAFGVLGSVVAFYFLLGQAGLDAEIVPALGVYASCVVALFCFSASYHMTPWPEYRPMLRRFDQAAIYFKIAGTYTPLVFLVQSTPAFVLLALIWLGASLGAMIKLATGHRLDRYTILIYLGLGWSSVLLLWPLYMTLNLSLVLLVLLGGVLYTIGIKFHQAKNMKFSNAIWHGFVLMASACHFTAIALAVS